MAIINPLTAKIVEKKAEVAKTSDPGGGKNILTMMLRSGHYSTEVDSSIRDQLLAFPSRRSRNYYNGYDLGHILPPSP